MRSGNILGSTLIQAGSAILTQGITILFKDNSFLKIQCFIQMGSPATVQSLINQKMSDILRNPQKLNAYSYSTITQ